MDTGNLEKNKALDIIKLALDKTDSDKSLSYDEYKKKVLKRTLALNAAVNVPVGAASMYVGLSKRFRSAAVFKPLRGIATGLGAFNLATPAATALLHKYKKGDFNPETYKKYQDRFNKKASENKTQEYYFMLGFFDGLEKEAAKYPERKPLIVSNQATYNLTNANIPKDSRKALAEAAADPFGEAARARRAAALKADSGFMGKIKKGLQKIKNVGTSKPGRAIGKLIT